jgi:hypothetical protein
VLGDRRWRCRGGRGTRFVAAAATPAAAWVGVSVGVPFGFPFYVPPYPPPGYYPPPLLPAANCRSTAAPAAGGAAATDVGSTDHLYPAPGRMPPVDCVGNTKRYATCGDTR